MPDQPVDRFDRERNVVDTMLTAHSILRDRYERRATGLTLLIMALSVLATGVAFISGEPETSIGPFTARVQVWVGVLTCIIFFLSIVDLLVEWRRRAWAHEEAVRRFSDLKAKYRHGERDGEIVRADLDLTAEYERTWDAVSALSVAIKDAQFTKLKQKHWRKVEISKRISARPERPRILHRLDVLREGLSKTPRLDGRT
jgi:uncharacterized membrane protein YcjF (UPF0283 family)